jgi:hypothetical protein
MTVSNLSTSNSDAQNMAIPISIGRKVLIASLWAVLWLVLIDVVLNIMFALPNSPLQMPTKMQSYFDYGRTVESKLRFMVGAKLEDTALIAKAGWLVESDSDQQPEAASGPDKILIAAYGQSFTNQICHALAEQDAHFELRLKAGPSAALPHSYAFYKADASHQQADVVVLGILASSMVFSMAPTIATINFEGPAPYTYPQYYLEEGELRAHEPVIHSLAELRAALWSKPEVWDEYLHMMEMYSPTYNSWIFKSDWLDYSALGRLVRRSIGQKHVHDMRARYWTSNGFTNADGLLDISSAIITDFVQDVKSRGQIPYVLLIQDQGFKDHLALAFAAQFKQLGVPYLSTHLIASSQDVRNFVSDGHFTPEVTKKVAEVLRADLLDRVHKTK